MLQFIKTHHVSIFLSLLAGASVLSDWYWLMDGASVEKRGSATGAMLFSMGARVIFGGVIGVLFENRNGVPQEEQQLLDSRIVQATFR